MARNSIKVMEYLRKVVSKEGLDFLQEAVTAVSQELMELGPASRLERASTSGLTSPALSVTVCVTRRRIRMRARLIWRSRNCAQAATLPAGWSPDDGTRAERRPVG